MCYVNFVRENMAFMEYARNEMLTANERLLWYALLHIMNRRANGSDWPEGFISVTNGEVLSYCPFGEDSLAASRNKLIQRGLIDYVKGERNKKAPQYKMCYFYPELSTGQSTENESYPKISGNIGGNTRGNTGGNSWGNDGGNTRGNMGGIYINNNDNLYPLPKRELNTDTITHATFVPPTPEEVAAYCEVEGIKTDAKRFVDWYAGKGWMVGNSPMVDWKAILRCWRDDRARKVNDNLRKGPRVLREQSYTQREYPDDFSLPDWMAKELEGMA